MTDTQGPLSGLTVLDLTRVLSGPYCTMMLADMGARVIKIEQPGKGDDTRRWGPPFQNGESSYFMSINRNKQSLTLNMKHAGRTANPRGAARHGRRVGRELPTRRDGTDGTRLRGRGRPLASKVVYCSVSGFGQTGPRREQPGYDAVMQGEGGLMSITGDADGPAYRLGRGHRGHHDRHVRRLRRSPRRCSPVTTSGKGQYVDLGMLDAVAALLTYQAGIYFATGEAPQRMGNRHPTIVPYETLEASDGELVVAVGNENLWAAFCKLLDANDLHEDPRFATNDVRVAAPRASSTTRSWRA